MIVWKLSFVLLTISCFVLPSSSTSIFDLIEWGISDKGPENRAEDSTTEGQRSCKCEGSSCLCCVDFNITYVDLGGPGCVMIKYLSQDEGFAVNVSYGNSLLNSQVVKGANPAPTCINLLTRVVQLCARLTDLAPTSEGLRGCLQLEPTLLRESQLEFPLGCFRSGPEGMSMEKNNATKEEEEAPEEKPTTEEPSSINTAQIIQVVNESAEQGIAFFSNLLGLAFGRNNATDTTDDDDDDDDEAVVPESNTNSQSESKANQRQSKQFYFRRGPNDV